ncbi:hypothetical protein BDN72DRAFT_843748 [Pluteus cervinus]|uniref:Uncharacterized protein n=1 Tax=Pluteus cervinus TaxID=181527 RepID=A0ACD3AMU2_9AGAR|nr:hypothetical protein BDN72DRAFT_843748 [Pluteus cervinus]
MDANGSATTQMSHCTVYNTIHNVTYASETKITTTTTAREETNITSTTAPEEVIEEIPRITTDRLAEGYTRYPNRFASTPITHREISSGLSFQESFVMLNADIGARRRSVIWQESERISRMQVHSEFFSSTAALAAAPHRKQLVPVVDWRLLQGPIGYREQMERYAKRDPLFVASLFLKSADLDLDWMLLWLSEAVINVHKLCTTPMVLITANTEASWTRSNFKFHDSWRIDVSIIETGYTTRIPRYQALHDPTRTRPRIIPPTHSVPASTAKSSSSNNQQFVPAPRKKSPQTFGPKPPSVVPRPNSNQGVTRTIPTGAQPSAIPLRVAGAPVTKRPIPKDVSKPSYSPPRYSRPVSGLRPSTQQDRSPKKEPTLTGQMEELKETVKKQGMILEKQNVLLERLTARLG